MPERKRKKFDIGSAIGFVIFLLAVAGGPILRGLGGLLGGSLQLASYLPYIVGALVLLSFAVSAVRAAGARRRRDPMGLPDRVGPTDDVLPRDSGGPLPGGDPGMPMLPPLGGDVSGPRFPVLPPAPPQPRLPRPPGGYTPKAPQFEPLFSPAVLAVGLLGLVVLAGAALVVFGAGAP